MRRRAVIPKQPDRFSQALREASDAQHRSQRTAAPHLDGDGQTISDDWAIGEAKRVRHSLGRPVRGVQVVSMVQAASATSGTLRWQETNTTRTSVLVVNDTGVALSAKLWVY